MGKSHRSRSSSRSVSRSPAHSSNHDSYKPRARLPYKRQSSRGEYSHKRKYERSKSRSNSQEDRRGRSDIKAKKRSSRSRSSSKGKRVIFDFEVFLSAHYIRVLTDNNAKTIKRIKDQVRIHQIVFDHDLSIPGLDGSVIKLSDDSYTCKYNALLKILKEIEEYQTPNKKDRHECSITILVPEGMVSLLIGSKGRQINNIMRESRTQIVVNPAIHKMTYRTVNIDGKPESCANACRIIYQTLENISPNVEKIEKTPKPLEIQKTRITAKIVFPQSSVGFIIGKEGTWIKELCDRCGVSIKFQQDSSIRCVKKDEAISIIKGKLSGVINAVVIILRRSHEYENNSKHYVSDVIKLLIPNNFVTKLIGAKGCMIREIAAKAGGAQIKIMSDKQSEREHQDCIVTIAGSLANKQDAVCYILEQIEIFKNGGPILLNGKAINENLAQQFRNSLPPRDSTADDRRESFDETNDLKEEHHSEKIGEELMENGEQRDVIEGINSKFRSHSKSVDGDASKILEYDDDVEKVQQINVEAREPEFQEPSDPMRDTRGDDYDHKEEIEPIKDPRAEKYKDLIPASELAKIIPHSPKENRRGHSGSERKRDYPKSISRSRSRSRSKSKSLRVRNGYNKSRSPSSEKSRRTQHRSGKDSNSDNRKSSPKSRQHNGTERKDVTKNSHYIDSNGDVRITTTIIVPNYLVPYLIGKNGETIKDIETKTSAKISFQRENKSGDAYINTAEGIRGRIVSIAGSPDSLMEAFRQLMDEIMNLEKTINGVRYDKS